jgi:large subunit ribosomal protein L15
LKKAGLINKSIKRVKIILSGNLERAVTVRGLGVTKGARAAIESAGGKIEE